MTNRLPGVYLGTGLDQLIDNIRIPGSSGEMKRCYGTRGGPGHDVAAGRYQDIYDLGSTVFASQVQSRVSAHASD